MNKTNSVAGEIFKPVFLLLTMLMALGASFPTLAGTEYYRLENHMGSWSSLAIIITAVLTAVFLNYKAPNIRVYGTVLAALGCFAVVGWFIFVIQSGFMENPRKNYVDTPIDPIKPALLWIQAITALVVGLFLLRAAVWQSKRTDELVLPAKNTETSFGLASRYLHWVTAILFISLIPMGIFSTLIHVDTPWRQGYYVAHKTIGFTVLFLLIVRVIWHIMTPTPKLDSNLKPWEYWLAKLMHYGLYFLMIMVPLSGYLLSTYAGFVSHFFIWDTPMLVEKNLDSVKIWSLAHKIVLPFLCYIVIGAHIVGALKHHFVDKHHESIHRMVS